jgi:DNA polymerase-3 subunit beta
MQLSVNKDALAEVLAVAKNIAPGSDPRAALNCLLLEADGDSRKLVVSATDLEIGFKAQIECGEVNEPGAAVLSARRLAEIVSKLAGDEVKLDARDDSRVEIKGGSAKFRLPGLDARAFPTLDRVREARVKVAILAKDFRAMADRAAKVISNAVVSGYSTHGALLEAGAEGTLRLVATDGHRLMICERAAGFDKDTPFKSVVVPRKGVLEIARLVGPSGEGAVTLEIGQRMIVVRIGERELSVRTVEGSFPDYRSILPAKPALTLKVNRDAISDALGRVTLVSDQRFKAIRLTLAKEFVTVAAKPGEFGEASEPVAIAGAEAFEGDASFEMNADYLIAALDSVEGDDALIDYINSQSMIMVRSASDAGYWHVVAPMFDRAARARAA